MLRVDHSLIRDDGSITSPDNVKLGDFLLHQHSDQQLLDSLNDYAAVSDIDINPDEAFAMGVFFAKGLCFTTVCQEQIG